MIKFKEFIKDVMLDEQFFREIYKLKSPAYIYNFQIIESIIDFINIEKEKRKYIKLYFAVKANNNIELLTFMKSKVDGFDVASIEELNIINSLSITDYNINGPSFSVDIIEELYINNKNIDFNSISHIEYLMDKIQGNNIGVRVNLPYINDIELEDSRFGINLEDDEFLLLLKSNNILINNLHFHNGKKNKIFFNQMEKILKNIDYSIIDKKCSINLGGGIEEYITTDKLQILFESIDELYEICLSNGIDPIFIIEPGMALVHLSGYMLTSVLSSDLNTKNNELNIVLNSSAHNLHTWIKPTIVTTTSKKTNKLDTNIYGNTCYEKDIFFNKVNIKELNIGDRLILSPVGAYSRSNYNNLHLIPFPDEYYYYKSCLWK